ncbi:hypothetical protein AQUCO_01400089v1 [Aquilegia coerulea]|uniref:Pentacotripeptide-repeat region of PRORP domain-containing protein n=1 Tax=Aquilegia coerulea TaxID=218851 RepID=A0A2G5DUH8_AQUCA|nr:hypothetical protein AQUCO_01400089v1 [Aquilegia coerulea]
MGHSCILKSGFESDIVISNKLLHVYCSCSSLSDALKVFNEMPERDVVSWNTMISGYAGSGYVEDGVKFYLEMRLAGVDPSQSSFVSVLIALVEMGNLEYCRQVHDLKESRKLFDRIQKFDEVSLEILLRGYLQEGISIHDAIELFKYSFLSGVPFSIFAISSVLSLCASVDGIVHGIQIHGYVVKDGRNTNISIVNALITMYARSYRLNDAVCLFDEARLHDIVAWNSLIAGYAFNSEGDLGLDIVGRFLSTGMQMNESTFSSLHSCCTNVTSLESARKAHALIIKLREFRDIGSDNVILTMYCKCRSLNNATSVFKTLVERDTVSYNLIVGLFRIHGWFEESIRILHLIQLEGFKVDECVYSNLISSCSRLFDSEVGQQIHACIIKTGFDMIAPLGNSLLEMYSHCGKLKDMEKIVKEIDVPDIFTWNTILMGYTNFGFLDQSIQVWEKMKISGVVLNEFSYCAIVDICTYVEAPLMGEQIHATIKKLGLGSDTALMNSIITMYSNCEIMEKASMIFEEIPVNDSVSWNAMICGYAQNGFTEKSIEFYLLMNISGSKPNNMTFASIFKSCADHSLLLLGLQFHTEVIKTGLELSIIVSNSLITMYAKCGEINDATKIFMNTRNNRDVITWNSMICAFAHHGCGREALDTFSEMKALGEKPNAVTFVGALSACGHAGLISEASAIFDSMFQEHSIVPSEEHYACLVDIFCRAGRLGEAKELIRNMPYNSCSLIWRTFLSACRTYENIEFGKEAAEKLMQLEPHDSSAYVLLSNIYASVEKMEEKAEMRRIMKYKSVQKDVGFSLICS